MLKQFCHVYKWNPYCHNYHWYSHKLNYTNEEITKTCWHFIATTGQWHK